MFKKDVILPKIPDKADEVTRKFYTDILQVVKDLRQDVYSSVREEIIRVESTAHINLSLTNGVWADILTIPLKKGIWDLSYGFDHDLYLAAQTALWGYSGIGKITGNQIPDVYYQMDGYYQTTTTYLTNYILPTKVNNIRYKCNSDETLYLKGMGKNYSSSTFTYHRAYWESGAKTYFQAKRVTESEDGI